MMNSKTCVCQYLNPRKYYILVQNAYFVISCQVLNLRYSTKIAVKLYVLGE